MPVPAVLARSMPSKVIWARNRMEALIYIDQTVSVYQRQKGIPLVFLTRWHNSLIEVAFRGYVRTFQDGVEIPAYNEVVAVGLLLLHMSRESLVEINPSLSLFFPVARTRDVSANKSARFISGCQYSPLDGRTTLRQPEVDRSRLELGEYSTPRVTCRLDWVDTPSPVHMPIPQHE